LAIAGLGFFAALIASLIVFGGATELGFPSAPCRGKGFATLFGAVEALGFAFAFALLAAALFRLFLTTVLFVAGFNGVFAGVAEAVGGGFGTIAT